ncbi:growth hormone-inducible transmembrane protein [Octopus bimaculoides]|uniref:Growth hormone-inducible transmembrane protein n=1 Tax=Octopus bimaculoides TaxID=37653 RepID=A0A0L8HCM7_OCTBM|nr:growth hormone-inducible transmembrane protein [Octopus bimaculoides]XP_052821725.1 growth hormone-inducible transmembrane protein [Octopus bimaculoides]|eukprot:XP_014773800.1 PREDICTED: growth hormone-inducible transmembrane protein-like [Octopus bimaculoides]
MLATTMSRLPMAAVTSCLSRSCILTKAGKPSFYTPVQMFTNQARASTRRATRAAKARSLKEIIMAPATDTSFNLGRGLVAGASVIGLGSLCYYGLGLSNEVGAIERAAIWPEIVQQRIRDTYLYFGGSIGITALSAMAVYRNPTMLNLMMKNSWLAIGATFAAMIGSSILVRSIPYQPGVGAKQFAWMLHSGVVGAVIAPLCLLGGPVVVRAAWYTAGVVGGLSTLAMCAPSEKFLNMGGPLAAGLGVVFVSSIGGMFLPPTTALGAGLYSISIYGGLVLFSMFLLYDTQKIIKKAETHPVYAMRPYDPIDSSIGIYMDTINIFIRIVTILSGGSNRRR